MSTGCTCPAKFLSASVKSLPERLIRHTRRVSEAAGYPAALGTASTIWRVTPKVAWRADLAGLFRQVRSLIKSCTVTGARSSVTAKCTASG